MFESLPEAVLPLILKNLDACSLALSSRVNKFLYRHANKFEFWKNAVEESELAKPLQEKILTVDPANNAKAVKTRLLKVLKMKSDIPHLSVVQQDLFTNRPDLTTVAAQIMLYHFPEIFTNSLPANPKCFGNNVYKSTLPNTKIFNLAINDTDTALAFLKSPSVYNFLSTDTYVRYICLLAAKQPKLIEYLLSDPVKNAFILQHEDFLYPLKKHPKYQKFITQDVVNENYSSIRFFYNHHPEAPPPRNHGHRPNAPFARTPGKRLIEDDVDNPEKQRITKKRS